MDLPPVSIISTDPSSYGSSSGQKSSQRVEVPMILMKKTKPQSISDDPRLISDGFTSIASPEKQFQTRASDKEVDSALLSALRDNRERMALLRLEQTMIDFMMDKTCDYMDVGGPFNSIAIKCTTGGADLENFTSRNYDGGGRQTSFQRLCLHRLADRFKILREQIQYSPTDISYFSYGLIRLVKTKESRIPKVKLLGIDLTEYDSPDSLPHSNLDIDTNAVAERISKIDIQDKVSQSTGSRKKTMEQVMIMKRNHNSIGDRNDKSTKTNSRRRGKGKEFTDKEKAYAEARARIFASDFALSNDDCDQTFFPSGDNTDSETMLNSTSHSFNSSPTDQNEVTQPNEEERSIFPKATTTEYNSKVTWRNREQEASDPDFRRSYHPSMPSRSFGEQYVQSLHGNYYYDYPYAEEGQQPYIYAYSYPQSTHSEIQEYSTYNGYVHNNDNFQGSQNRVSGNPSIRNQKDTILLSPEEFPALR